MLSELDPLANLETKEKLLTATIAIIITNHLQKNNRTDRSRLLILVEV